MIVLVANLLSAAGAACLAYSTFSKNKEKLVLWQLGDYTFLIISNLLLGGYSGAVSVLVSVLRNVLILRGEFNKVWGSLIIILQVVLALRVNHLGWIGLLPIVASSSYTLALMLTNNLQILRWVVIENMLLWIIYDLTIKAYPAFTMDFIIAITTYLSIQKKKNVVENQFRYILFL